mmetsp:Transcript_5545/g.14067  ORF Transcript_5545/g.14067 Transcript_5545/m.14067 type:complete len:221 (-) Transcript_5545:1179-1841(-)
MMMVPPPQPSNPLPFPNLWRPRFTSKPPTWIATCSSHEPDAPVRTRTPAKCKSTFRTKPTTTAITKRRMQIPPPLQPPRPIKTLMKPSLATMIMINLLLRQRRRRIQNHCLPRSTTWPNLPDSIITWSTRLHRPWTWPRLPSWESWKNKPRPPRRPNNWRSVENKWTIRCPPWSWKSPRRSDLRMPHWNKPRPSMALPRRKRKKKKNNPTIRLPPRHCSN